MKLISLESVVIVEGKYDKINLENYIDATIITTDGFQIFKDRNKQKLIRFLCEKNGAVIITDSDNAGAQIRAYLKNICKNAKIVNVYLPQIAGKEKRKAYPSKQGFLGAEGLSGEIILEALNKSGVAGRENNGSKITKTDLYAFALSGHTNSKSARESFAIYSGLPTGLSSNAFLDALNAIYTREIFLKEADKWRQQQAKS